MLSVIREHGEEVLESHATCNFAMHQAFSNLKILDAETNYEFQQFVLAELNSQPLWMAGAAAQKE
jgi:hypothetical protein